MNKIVFIFPGILLSWLCLAQNLPTASAAASMRRVQGQTIVSNELPAAELTFGNTYRYIGGQVVNLYGNADAEQHLFVSGANTGTVTSFYWVQFEHFLPSNKLTYDYAPTRTTDIGGLQFIYDVKSFSDYAAAMQDNDPASDAVAIGRLLSQHNLAFPRAAARVRMFYLPTPDRRTELMIIYGEALSKDSKVPMSSDGVHLDEASPESAKVILDHARQGLVIHKR